ncbi:MAG: 4-hydroxybenzoate octaprenyltransferase [Candidatus Melainabacteria bacterium]|nr:4-hydroxybenzoate octaprenyltransferase [Candidatus Melainabacteria bacterium]MBI3308135.1 4-hydroxybenzoate octaprenyltransferase [Candidatus Melainabacteria bacterium]
MVTKYLNFIKFEHSVFALPFALSGALLAKENGFPELGSIFFIILAAASARSLAMSLNRIIDKDIDSKNPRTKNRELPKGTISINQAVIFSVISLILLLYATLQLPRICLYLLPIAGIWFFIYPFTKRFTYLSHLWLGVALGASVLAGWIAITGEINSIIPFILGFAVVFWVAGFDIIYACQDFEHDKSSNLCSIPARFGIKNALLISRFFHLLTGFLLVLLGTFIETSIIYWFSVIFVIGMLFYEQSLVKPNDLSKVNLAFFTLNGWISIGFFIFILIEKLV